MTIVFALGLPAFGASPARKAGEPGPVSHSLPAADPAATAGQRPAPAAAIPAGDAHSLTDVGIPGGPALEPSGS